MEPYNDLTDVDSKPVGVIKDGDRYYHFVIIYYLARCNSKQQGLWGDTYKNRIIFLFGFLF